MLENGHPYASGSAISVAMVAPNRERCGITDYSRYLLRELKDRVDVRYIVDAEGFVGSMNDVDIVHVQHQYFLFGGVAPWKCRFGSFAAKVKRPIVFTAHEFVEPKGNALFRLAVKTTNRLHFGSYNIKRFIVHTNADKIAMVGQSIPAERISVIRHGIPPPPVLSDRETARENLGLNGKFVVTLFGFMSRRKGHLLAVNAFTLLPDCAILLIAGGRHPDDRTDYVDQLEQAIIANGLRERVRITGYLKPTDVANVMSATDVVVAPFAESSGSGSLAMAFSCGKPVLASDITPHREIVGDAPGALRLFPSLDVKALALSLESLMVSPEEQESMALGSREYGIAHSYGRMAEETVSVYGSLLSEERV